MTRMRLHRAVSAIPVVLAFLALSGCSTGYYSLQGRAYLPTLPVGNGRIQTDVHVYATPSGVTVSPNVRYETPPRRWSYP